MEISIPFLPLYWGWVVEISFTTNTSSEGSVCGKTLL